MEVASGASAVTGVGERLSPMRSRHSRNVRAGGVDGGGQDHHDMASLHAGQDVIDAPTWGVIDPCADHHPVERLVG